MAIFTIILFIVSLIVLGISFYQIKNVHQRNFEADKVNQKIKEEAKNLDKQIKKKLNEYDRIKYQIQNAEQTLNTQKSLFENQEELSKKAFENYCQILEKDLKEKEEEYNKCKNTMETSYSNLQQKLLQEINNIQKDLNKIRNMREAATEAIRREKEIEKQLSFYCLQVNDSDLKDIGILESIKPKLNSPRILSMLIWQTYFRKIMTELCNNVIGTTIKTGIYKITNIKTKECYIGQAADLATRWKEHAKCGLGIDTPAANKLYKAMQEYGIWNFSWEVIEECKREELNEKEKYYIELYDSKNFGYNSVNGIKK